MARVLGEWIGTQAVFRPCVRTSLLRPVPLPPAIASSTADKWGLAEYDLKCRTVDTWNEQLSELETSSTVFHPQFGCDALKEASVKATTTSGGALRESSDKHAWSYDARRARDDHGGGFFSLGRKYASLRHSSLFCIVRQKATEANVLERVRVVLTRQPCDVTGMQLALKQVVLSHERCLGPEHRVGAEAEWREDERPKPFGAAAATSAEDTDVSDNDQTAEGAPWLRLPIGVAVRCTADSCAVRWWWDDTAENHSVNSTACWIEAGRQHDSRMDLVHAWFSA